MRGRTRFSVRRYRRERLVALEREVEYLRAERLRLEKLLGLALQIATGGTTVASGTLLALLCELTGTNPERAAMFEERA